MPRNASGDYTLPSPENPVVTGTVITASDFNTTMDDLAAEMEDSLSRSGKGGMLVPFEFIDGTQAAPGITFTNETGSGWYRSAAGVVRAAILGTWRLLINATGIQVNGNASILGTLSVTGATTLGTALGRDALPSVGQQVSASSTTFNGSDLAYTAVTNLTVNLTTSASNRPVRLLLQPDGGANPGLFKVDAGVIPGVMGIAIVRTTGGVDTTIAQFTVVYAPATEIMEASPTLEFLDTTTVASTAYTYTIKYLVTSGTGYISYLKLVAYEL